MRWRSVLTHAAIAVLAAAAATAATAGPRRAAESCEAHWRGVIQQLGDEYDTWVKTAPNTPIKGLDDPAIAQIGDWSKIGAAIRTQMVHAAAELRACPDDGPIIPLVRDSMVGRPVCDLRGKPAGCVFVIGNKVSQQPVVTPELKKKYAKLSAELTQAGNQTMLLLGLPCVLAGQLPSPSDLPPGASEHFKAPEESWSKVGADVAAEKGCEQLWEGFERGERLAEKYRELAHDPPDRNFTLTQGVAVYPIAAWHPMPGLPATAARALTAVERSTARIDGLTAALLTAIERAEGAAEAHQLLWRRQQTAFARRYGLQLAAELGRQRALRARLAQTLRGSALDVTFTPGAAAALVRRAAAVPATTLTVPAAAIQSILERLPQTRVAGASFLSDPALLDTLGGLAATLRAWALQLA